MSQSIQRQFIKILQARQKAKAKSVEGGDGGNLIPIPYLTLGTTITAAPTALATLATLASHSVLGTNIITLKSLPYLMTAR